MAEHTIAFAPPPDPTHDFLAVASYDDGIIIHDLRAPYAMKAALGIGGAPSDLAIDPRGEIAAGATDDTTATVAQLRPWNAVSYANVPFTDELAFDETTGALFLTNRGTSGPGAITRIATDGTMANRTLGLTSEGLAIDAARRRVYVANVNDGTVSIVDADSLAELKRFKAVDRVFSLALSSDGSRLYAVSNQSVTSPFAKAGSVVAIDVAGAQPHVVARSAALVFPIGVALDANRGRLFVTDEHDDEVYVLDARTLAPQQAPLRTCRTPWKPTLDGDQLYVPCARANQIDVFNAQTLRREPAAPFATGGYPLAVAVWHAR